MKSIEIPPKYSKYKVGDQKVFVVNNPGIQDYQYDSEVRSSQYRIMLERDDGTNRNTWLLCKANDVFEAGELIAAEVVKVRDGGVDWRRIGDE